jgi:hypothetical protein
LPATVSLRDLGPGPTLLGEAIVPDPCFWSPESPALYDVEVALVNDRGEAYESTIRQLGIRSLGIRGSLYLEGKRWVVRGAERAIDPSAPVSAWREAWCSPLVASRDEGFLEEASRLGVVAVVAVAGSAAEIETELLRLSHWPAAAIAIIDCSQPLDAAIADAAPNLLLGWRMHGSDASPPAWAQIIFVDVEASREFVGLAALKRPVVAMRRLAEQTDLGHARSACDVLQRDLAPYGDFAGYIVVSP